MFCEIFRVCLLLLFGHGGVGSEGCVFSLLFSFCHV